MEHSLTTLQFLQIAGFIGLPVHAFLVAVSAWLLRSRLLLSWPRLFAASLCLLALSLCLQVAAWALGPELPEELFMLFGFINTPALFGAAIILSALFFFTRRGPL
jgi:uncharacterized membrane protein